MLILVSYRPIDTLDINGYYNLNEKQYQHLKEWYNEYLDNDYYINDNIILNKDNFNIIEIDEDNKINLFISKYNNPFNILEHIFELQEIFMDDNANNVSNSDSDDDLITETENITKLIDAHLSGNKKNINSLLKQTKYNENDDIIKKIKNYENI